MNRISNPYEILGLQQDASESDVKKAYKNLARKCHPDKGGTEEKFKEINQAYTQIINGDPMEEFPELNEIFNNFFAHFAGMNTGMNMGVNIGIKGPTIKTRLEITLEQSEVGGVFSVIYKRNVPTGNFLNSVSHTPFGVINVMTPEEVEKTFEVNVEIPRCHDQRKSLIFSRLARADPLPPGDLEVIITIVKHPVFTRISGTLDLQTELTISLKESLIGFDREIKLLNSEETVKLECRSIVNPYDIKKIQNYGMKYDENMYGSLLIKFIVRFPVILSAETLNVINELDLD